MPDQHLTLQHDKTCWVAVARLAERVEPCSHAALPLGIQKFSTGLQKVPAMVKRDNTNSRSANITVTPAHMATGRRKHGDQGLRALKWHLDCSGVLLELMQQAAFWLSQEMDQESETCSWFSNSRGRWHGLECNVWNQSKLWHHQDKNRAELHFTFGFIYIFIHLSFANWWSCNFLCSLFTKNDHHRTVKEPFPPDSWRYYKHSNTTWPQKWLDEWQTREFIQSYALVEKSYRYT